MPAFDNYREARQEAHNRANSSGLAVGIRKVREYGQERFVVAYLPRSDKRFGEDLRAEVVEPS